ncbi:MAG: hypothetical protein ABG776_08895, partial [Cyanobacteria bacterium J06555_13]
VGYLSVHRELPVLRRSHANQPPSEIAQYCVEASVKQLQNESTHHLLMAATLFTGKFSTEAVAHVAALAYQPTDIDKEFSSLHRLSLVNKLDSIYYSMHAFTQDFVKAKLDQNLAFKQEAQERWITWYIDFLEPFSDYWCDWQDYSQLETEWSNIRALVNWCMEAGEYEAAKTLWQGLQSYVMERGYWDECQDWMNSLMIMAKQRDDKNVLVEAMFYKGQALIRTDETDTGGTALQLFKDAWALTTQENSDIRFGTLTYIAAINIKRNQFAEARTWLDKRKQLKSVSQLSQARQQCILYYYTAEIALRQQKYEEAENSYRKALTFAKKTEWEKLSVYCKAWLATTLLKKGQLNEAEVLITFALESAKSHKDRRSVANCYYNLALLAEKREQVDSFCDWTSLAKNEFEALGMTIAVNQMNHWLDVKHSTDAG